MATIKKANGVHGDDLVNFEKGRIKQLQEERLHIQKKTFTKWMNSFLLKARMEVEDLFRDLADGRKLLKLLEIISGEKLGKPNNGKMRVHHVENVNKSLAFLHTKVRLESIGAEDIVDGNPRLILGLIWTIILRFQIQEIEIDVDEDNHESSEKKSAKDALLLWCQRKTNGYPNVQILDFTGSWRSGLGFNALIHAHRPDLINFSSLVPTKHIDNLNNAFDTAEGGLGIPRLLDAEDIDCPKPDEKSILTYVASYYHTFARMKSELKGGRRIANIINQIMEADNLKQNYEHLTTDLLSWITSTTTKFDTTPLPTTLASIKAALSEFKTYRTTEKPPKYAEKSEIEANYFNINIRLKELKQNSFTPPDGRMLHDIEKAWELLEKSENRLETRLKSELIRQTQLEALAFKFEKKADLRSGYLKDMIQVLSDPRYGVAQTQVEATLKKHEAISADIMAREERCKQLKTMCDFLGAEKYHGHAGIKKRSDLVLATWDALMKLLDKHRENLKKFNDLNLRRFDVENCCEEIRKYSFVNKNPRNLEECQDFLQSLNLNEVEIANLGDVVRRILKNGCHGDGELEKEMGNMDMAFKGLLRDLKFYRGRLEERESFYRVVGDLEEEVEWVEEKRRIVGGGLTRGVKDLRGVVRVMGKLKTLQEEIRARSLLQQKLFEKASDLSIETSTLSSKINQLATEIQNKTTKLVAMEKMFQQFQDCNEIQDWINEKRPLVESTDYGVDVPSATALLQRHKDLIIEIESFHGDVEALGRVRVGGDEDAEGIEGGEEESPDEIWTQEQRLVPQDYFEEETADVTEYKTVTEERPVAQVKALYPFNGTDQLEMVKGEVMFLLSKTNGDWWNVRKSNGVDGFVPANYVKEIEPKVVLVQVRKPHVVKETKRVKKTKMVMQSFNVKKLNPRAGGAAEGGKKNLEARIGQVVGGYQEICQLGESRLTSLHSSIALHTYLTETADFEKWLQEKSRQLSSTTSDLVSIETAKKNFDVLFTDLSASTKRLESIDAMAAALMQNHGAIVKPRQKAVHKLYDELNKLKNEKEKSLAGASIVELFHRNSAELEDWILEKQEQIEHNLVFHDLKTVQALQRRHLNIERELVPIREKLERVKLLASDATAQYPRERPAIQKSLQKSNDLFAQLLDAASSRRSRLDHAVGKEIFQNSFRNLKTFAETMETQFSSMSPIPDVSTAEDELKKHELLLDELKNKQDEFSEVLSLGTTLSASSPNLLPLLTQLTSYQTSLPKQWQEKQDHLQQTLDLKMFEKEADSLDRQLQPNPNQALGSTLTEVEDLLKQHNNHSNNLMAMEDRVNNFVTLAEKLEKIHSQREKIGARKEEIVKKRKDLLAAAGERKKDLLKSLRFHEFATEVQDMTTWVQEKTATLQNEDYKDLQNLDKKLKKHQVFSGELRSNETKLKSLNKFGEKLQNEKNNPEKTASLLSDLNEQWSLLSSLCSEQYSNLKQSLQQQSYNKSADAIATKLADLEQALTSTDLGKDRRACKELLKKHDQTEADLANLDKKIADLLKHGQELKDEGHFDGDRIVAMAMALKDQLEKLKSPAKKRRQALEELLKFYDFLFDLDNELLYIEEKKTILTMATLPGDLHEAVVRVKKIAKFEAELVSHGNQVVDRVLERGETMIKENHPEKRKVKKVCEDLKSAWKELLELTEGKKTRLEFSLKTHQYYNDAVEVEGWINEKINLLSSPTYGTTKSASVALLTKHKTLELEIDSYSSLITETAHLISKQNPDYPQMLAKQSEIQSQMENLRELANKRRNKLMETMNKHEFYLESEDFRAWIEEMIVFCSSEEYGVDFEHLERIRGKFLNIKKNILTAESRLEGLDKLVGRIREQEEKSLANQEGQGVGNRWNVLLSTMEARELKLHAAGEIHRFNRDVAEALERINEKLGEIPEELGKDYNSCETLLRNMENFENDLVPLEAQLQVLIDDSSRLSTLYPSNAPNISEEQALVIANWKHLQQKTDTKKSALQSTLDYYKFLSFHATLSNWASNLQKQLEKLETKPDAQLLLTEHEQTKLEIQSRDEKYAKTFDLAKTLPKIHKEEADIKTTQLKTQKKQLITAWERKKIYLDQLIDLQIFKRDAKQLETILNSQETVLNQQDTSSTVEEVEKSLKKHGELENVINKQENKFLMTEGNKLIQQDHFEKSVVAEIIKEITAKRENVKSLASTKRALLESKLFYQKFARDVEESLSYLEEKQKQLENLNKETSNLEEKIKKLKKHQAFEAELSRTNVPNVINQARSIDPVLYDKLSSKYARLLALTSTISKDLEEAQEILDFQNAAEKLEQWMRERESLVQSNDLGKDFEHCEELIKRLQLEHLDNDGIVKINESRLVDPVNSERKSRIITRWNDLKSGLADYKKKLEDALMIHRFHKEIDELDLRIKEKIPSCSVEDVGKDLDSVEALLRKQDQLENQMKVIETRIKELETDSDSDVAMEKISASWAKLSELCFKRRNDLTDSHSHQKYLKKLRELENFVESTINKLQTAATPISTTHAEKLLEEQKAVKFELEKKSQNFSSLKKEISRCIKEGHGYVEELENCITLSNELETKLHTAIATRDKVLDQGVKLQNFNKLSTETENLLNELDSVCKYYLGDELASILKMLKLHGDSKTLLTKCESKVMETTNFSQELTSQDHYESDKIQQKTMEINKKYNSLLKSWQKKEKSLKDSKNYQNFLQNLSQIENYLKEKLQTATDDNYSDMTNLQSKMQKHQAFEAEIGAYETRILEINNTGSELISNGNLHSNDIKTKLSELESLNEELKKESNNKSNRLYEAYQALLFFNNLEDLETFLEEPNYKENAENLSQTKYLLKKWGQIQENYNSKTEIKENLSKSNETFQKSSHFMKQEINEKVNIVFVKFTTFAESLQSKLSQLNLDLARFEYNRDVSELLDFLQEKNETITSLELGNSVESVKKLLKKLETIQNEVQSVQPSIQKLSDPTLTLEYEKVLETLQEKEQVLKQSQTSQNFYALVLEANFYIKEKTSIFSSQDQGVDEDSVTKLLKKFQTHYNNLQTFKQTVDEIIALAESLQCNYDSEKIATTLVTLKTSFSNLQKLADSRKQRLSDSSKLFHYLRESTELTEWIELQMNTAGSEDYGRDVEHVEILIQKFETFLVPVLNTGENRVEHLNQQCQSLVELKHPEEERILAKNTEVRSIWEEFKELATARTEALDGAKRVHMFDRTADETIAWINEKLVALSSGEEDLHNLIKASKQIAELGVEEKALEQQVGVVRVDAKELGALFPDAEEHVEAKLEETLETWNLFLSKTRQRQEKLLALETIRDYFNEYDDLVSYLVDVQGRISASAVVSEGVEQSEYNLQKFNEIMQEYSIKKEKSDAFTKKGTALSKTHFLSEEINQKLKNLQEKRQNLENTMEKRKTLLEQNVDLQKFFRDLNNFEGLLKTRQLQLGEEKEVESISQIEEILRQFEDVEVFLDLISDKLTTVERSTLIEQVNEQMRQKEKQLKEEERKKINQEVKQKEIDRIKGERSNSSGGTWGLFGDVLRRGSDPVSNNNLHTVVDDTLPRSSSFKSTPTLIEKKPKRTPSFTTRRRTQSFRKVKQVDEAKNLPPITIDGYLERKHENISNNKRASNRSWKTFYTVLCGQLLCFFKDQEDFVEGRNAAASPVNIFNCLVEVAVDYLKKRHSFRVRIFDGGEYLFACESESVMSEWVEKLNLVGKLEPREQLDFSEKKFDHQSGGDGHDGDQSSSEDEVCLLKQNKPRSREPLYANLSGSLLEEPLRNKPPIPPRSSSIIKNVEGEEQGARFPQHHHSFHSFLPPHQQPPQPPPKPYKPNPYHSVYTPTSTLPGHHQDSDLQPRSSGSLPTKPQRHHHDSSSESDSPKSGKTPQQQQKRSSTGLMGFLKRKKATQL